MGKKPIWCLGLDKKLILYRILKKYGETERVGFSWPHVGPVTGSCQYDTISFSVPKESGNFLTSYKTISL